MCLAAIHWAKIDRVVYGATIADAAAAGFCELHVDARFLAEMGKSPLKVEGGLLARGMRRALRSLEEGRAVWDVLTCASARMQRFGRMSRDEQLFDVRRSLDNPAQDPGRARPGARATS